MAQAPLLRGEKQKLHPCKWVSASSLEVNARRLLSPFAPKDPGLSLTLLPALLYDSSVSSVSSAGLQLQMSADFEERGAEARGWGWLREGPPGAHCLQLVCGLIQYLCLPLEWDGKSSKEEIKTTHRSECGSDRPGNQKTPGLLRLRFKREGGAAGTGHML